MYCAFDAIMFTIFSEYLFIFFNRYYFVFILFDVVCCVSFVVLCIMCFACDGLCFVWCDVSCCRNVLLIVTRFCYYFVVRCRVFNMFFRIRLLHGLYLIHKHNVWFIELLLHEYSFTFVSQLIIKVVLNGCRFFLRLDTLFVLFWLDIFYIKRLLSPLCSTICLLFKLLLRWR